MKTPPVPMVIKPWLTLTLVLALLPLVVRAKGTGELPQRSRGATESQWSEGMTAQNSCGSELR
jgi:hypothetical protein